MIGRLGKLRYVGAAGLLAIGSCQVSHVGDVGDAPRGMHVLSVSTSLLEITKPNVHTGWGVVTIDGRVHRRAGCNQPISGRVDIDILDAHQANIAWLTALLTPNPIPTEQDGEAGYTVSYGMSLPPGSTVRVHFVDQETAAREDRSHIESSQSTQVRAD